MLAADRCEVPHTDMALLFDSSGSISQGDFSLEKEGFARAVEDPSKVPQDGSVCLVVVEFNSTAAVRVPYRCLEDAADAAALAADIRAIPFRGGSRKTGVDIGIRRAAAELVTHARSDARQVVCLATDGLPNVTESTCNVRPIPACHTCASLDRAIANAKNDGLDELDVLTVEDRENELGPIVAADFTKFYGCRAFPSPATPDPFAPAFVVTVRDFAEFAEAIENQLAAIACTTQVALDGTRALPGDTARVTATLTNVPGTTVASAGSEVLFDPARASIDCGACRADGALTCTPIESGLRLTVAGGTAGVIGDGPLFSCDVSIPATAALGSRIRVRNRPHASASDGSPVTVVGRDATILVTSCPADGAACAADGAPKLRLARGRVRPRELARSALRMRAIVAGPAAASFDPLQDFVFVQLEPDGGTPFCAELPPGAFARQRRGFAFSDPDHLMASARGLDRLRIATNAKKVRVRIRGADVDMPSPSAGPLRVTLGFRRRGHNPSGGVCSTTVKMFRTAHKEGLAFP